MDNFTNQSDGDFSPVSSISKKKFIIIAVVFLLVAAAALGGYFYWKSYLSPEAKERRYMGEQVDKFYAAQAAFEKAMREDTYGGKTPQETLNMFINALKKGDVDLAAKYFMLDTNPNSSDYLTRKKWENALKKAKDDNRISQIITDLEKAEPAGSSIENGFGFEIKDSNYEVKYNIELEKNKYSKVWKIESM